MDIKHYYVEKGQGEPLVLLHGNGEDSSYFAAQTTVTLLVTYGNGTTHEECCEMVKVDNRWKIDVNLNSK